jgi:hypothetical protein
MPWSPLVEGILMHQVLIKGGHLTNGANVTLVWNQVLEGFFLQPEIAGYKPTHYTPNDFRSIRTHYTTMFAAYERDVISGNTSGRSGDRTEIYRDLKQIMEDISIMEEEKTAKTALEAQLASDEAEALADGALYGGMKKPINGWGKKKHLDGTITDSRATDPTRNILAPSKPRDAKFEFEKEIMGFLRSGGAPPTAPVGPPVVHTAPEEVVEREMTRYIKHFGLGRHEVAMSAVSQGEAHLAQYSSMMEVLDTITVGVLVSVYCTRNLDFKAAPIKVEYKELGLGALQVSLCSLL